MQLVGVMEQFRLPQKTHRSIPEHAVFVHPLTSCADADRGAGQASPAHTRQLSVSAARSANVRGAILIPMSRVLHEKCRYERP